jgi:hypothetical protein
MNYKIDLLNTFFNSTRVDIMATHNTICFTAIPINMEIFQTREALAIQDELIERYITPPSSPRFREPPAIQRVLIESGAFEDLYASWSQEEIDDYMRQQQEDEKNQPCCHYCHPLSFRESGVTPIYRGPAFSPITVPELEPMFIIARAQRTITDCIDEIEAWTRSLEALIADSRAIREAPLSAFANLAGHKDDDTISEPNIDEV